MRRWITIYLREEVIEALNELAERKGVSRSLLLKRGIELLFSEEGVEVYVRSRPVKEPKATAKTLGQQRGEKGVLILTPRKL